MKELEEEKDLETQLLIEEKTFVRYYTMQIDKLYEEHHEYFENKIKESKNKYNILPAITMKDPELLTIEEKEILSKMEKLLQMHNDGQEMEFKNEELLALDDKKEKEIPYWIQRRPELYQRYLEVRDMLNKTDFQFSESIFFPLPRKHNDGNQIEQELENLEGRDLEQIKDDYDKEYIRKARIGEIPDDVEDEYVKKSKVLGEVLNRISDQVKEEHQKELEQNRIPSEGKPMCFCVYYKRKFSK